MRIQPSKLRQWNTQFEFSVKYNISDCSTYTLTTKELFKIAGKEAQKKYLELSLGYTKTWGDEILKKEIRKLYRNTNITPGNILVTNGAIEAIFLIMNNIAQKGDNIIVQFPIYQALREVASSSGVKIKNWKLKSKNNFQSDLSELKKLIDNNTKAIIINQPQVPIGSAMDNNVLKELVNIAQKNNLYIISDEVCFLLLKNKKISPIADIYKKGISIGDLSKPFGAGGLRIGWLSSQDKNILEKCIPLRGYTTMTNSAPSEYLASLVIKNREKIIRPRIKIAINNFKKLEKFIQKYSNIFKMFKPVGGVTAFPKYKLDIKSENFCKGIIDKYNTMLVPGSVYGMENHFRIGFGCKPSIFDQGLSNFDQYIQSFYFFR